MRTTAGPQPIKGVLALRGIRNIDLAEQVGVCPHWIGRIVNGHDQPSSALADRIATVLDVPVDELFTPQAPNDADDVVAAARRILERSGADEGDVRAVVVIVSGAAA